MRYQHVCLEAFVAHPPTEIVTSEEIEARLKPVYERLSLPEGRLELMTGIRERRFYPPGTLPGKISVETVKLALQQSGLDPAECRALIHGSVCRDQMEPATAAGVHSGAGLPQDSFVFDVSNACLGLLNGALIIADLIELGRIRAGIVVGTEVGRPLVEATVDKLVQDPAVTRKSIKMDFASLTIGSGSAAIVLCHESISKTGNRLLGGACLADTTFANLCEGGVDSTSTGDSRPLMNTDSEALLHAGVSLAAKTWEQTKQELGWTNEDVTRTFTHQVGKAHRTLLLEQLGLSPALDFPTVEYMGNTGAAALPTAAALGISEGFAGPGDRIALLGIGSGLNSVMLGVDWKTTLK
ncbi:3-oxoacyl-[acyl-carrier-protein] synthase 3 [Thalassoglobus neptunius]|uniref:3-oxoacyl-[acyl-carrier-protein] synthase 3 n=1 Tax=Thalassoglobus neptunius TaxID=1938619 RepID=A0A5C5X390_9PLAN|nr:3-oxoacyl-ACP synthase III [Thalassoglobus neptunius]TWT56751.1 3-oxoacyl-[acyl-carrier-protein] synthase 3 [Thalassoglobus neptunius]